MYPNFFDALLKCVQIQSILQEFLAGHAKQRISIDSEFCPCSVSER